jgi:hypothetical protein
MLFVFGAPVSLEFRSPGDPSTNSAVAFAGWASLTVWFHQLAHSVPGRHLSILRNHICLHAPIAVSTNCPNEKEHLMAFPPNYNQERNNRAKAKQQKALEKQQQREDKSAQRKQEAQVEQRAEPKKDQ